MTSDGIAAVTVDSTHMCSQQHSRRNGGDLVGKRLGQSKFLYILSTNHILYRLNLEVHDINDLKWFGN